MRCKLTLLTLLLALSPGCSGVDEVQGPAPQRSASLTVVVWSAHTQRAVPAEGTLTFLSDGTRRELSTRANPVEGVSLSGLAPGPYRVRIHRRTEAGGRAQRVEGAEEIYLEPGARIEVTVVATDQAGELGLAPAPAPTTESQSRAGAPSPVHDPSSPAASSSLLPLTAARSGGPS